MTVSSGFFNSVNHDRLYDAEQLSSIFDGIIIDGVYENYGDAFMVTANPEANSSVLIGTGRAWFDHTWTVNDSTYAMQLDPPSEMLGRIDAIVIDVDRRNDVRKNGIVYIKGSESTPDQKPSLITEDLHRQYPIAYITRIGGQDSPISQSQIEYVVGTDTPIVTSVLEAQNLSNLWQQLNDEFDEWWDNIKATLDENTVTYLQNQIDEIRNMITGEDALVGLLEKPIADLFMTGNFNLNSGSYKGIQPISGQVFPAVSLLPDGKLLSIAYSSGTITVNLTNTEGINTPTQISTGMTPNGESLASVYEINAESYPVTVLVASHSMGASVSGSVWTPGLVTTLITIDNTGLVTHVNSDISLANSTFSPSSGTSRSQYYGRTVYCEKMLYDTYGYIVGHAWIYTGSGYIPTSGDSFIWTFTSDGVITNKTNIHFSSDSDRTPSPSFGGNLRKYDDTSWLGYAGTSVGSGIKAYTLNASTLQVTKITTQQSYPELSRYKAKYYAEINSLSETGGLSKVYRDIDDWSDESSTEKILNYFLGASNSSDGLPEGSFLCYKSDSRYYGVDSSGHQIAIGSNGGAAVLKTKVSAPASLALANIVGWNRGMIDVGSMRLYLIANPKTNSQPTVYYIKGA